MAASIAEVTSLEPMNNCSLEISKWGRELQNRAWLPPIDRQAHDTHVQFFLPINFSANSAPQLILKIVLVVSITVLI